MITHCCLVSRQYIKSKGIYSTFMVTESCGCSSASIDKTQVSRKNHCLC
uniref:Uncharacterized protein n=1 Tax=Anguilla anguilla TaxID=7936 RepID=A0A0E9RBJ5_ANGAN